MKKLFFVFFLLIFGTAFASEQRTAPGPALFAGEHLKFYLSSDDGDHMDGCDMDEAECPDENECEEMHENCMGDDDMGSCHDMMGIFTSNFFIMFLLKFFGF